MCNAKLAVCFVCFSSSRDKNVQSILPLRKPYHLIQVQLHIHTIRHTSSNLAEPASVLLIILCGTVNTCGQDILKIFPSAPVYLNTICHCASKQYGTCFKTILKFITSPVNWLCFNFLWTNEKSYGSHRSLKDDLNINITKHLKSIKHATCETRFTRYTLIEMWYFNPNTLLGSTSAIPYRSNMQS